jgi:hypothetical protein
MIVPRLRCAARALELASVLILLCFARPACAHVGSPNVFYVGDAGPYHLFVTVMVPQVIPGIAEVEVRTSSNQVREVSTVVTRLSGAGSRYAPVPDLAHRSAVDPHLFTSSVWLMEYGSLRILLKVSGSGGDAELSVPVASFARQSLPMPRWLGALLLALTAGLAVGAISIVGAAARDSRLPPGATADERSRHRGRVAMAVTAVLVAGIFYLAFAWWDADALRHARLTRLFKAPPVAVTLKEDSRLKLTATDPVWVKYRIMDKLLPDHGHLMHLFLIRTPAFDRFWHLHPVRNEDGDFEVNLPPLDAGRYQVFADVVDESGFPWTLVGTIDLPQINGAALSPDDSGGSFAPRAENGSGSATDVLRDGTRVVWQHEPLEKNLPLNLRFSVEDADGSPVRDMEPYMGMAAHLEIVRSDLSVFAHIHPSGSAPMAAVMLANGETGASRAPSLHGMSMPNDSTMAMPAKVEPELSMPYGFPKSGVYRIFVQFKRGNKIETAAFDTQVH